MITDWVRNYDATHRGAIVATLPHDLRKAANGTDPEVPADWIQLPDGAGSSVTFVNGAGESVTLTASSTVNTWAARATQITACSGNVICGTGQPPAHIVGYLFTDTGAGWIVTQ